jgi:hypothetical protein
MPNETPAIALNAISMSRVRIFAERAKARGDERSLEAWVEELMGFAIEETYRRWKSSDKYHNRNKFSDDLVKLNVIGADGAIKNPALLAQLVQKYGIVGGQQKEV